MKITNKVIFIIIGFGLVNTLCAQGFLNLNFEAANISGFSPGASNVPTNAALPGWTAHYFQPGAGIEPVPVVWYDTASLGGAVISINDTNTGSGFVPLQGRFSAWQWTKYNYDAFG